MSKMIFTVAWLCLLSNCVAGQSANEKDVLNAFTEVSVTLVVEIQDQGFVVVKLSLTFTT